MARGPDVCIHLEKEDRERAATLEQRGEIIALHGLRVSDVDSFNIGDPKFHTVLRMRGQLDG